MWTIRTVYLKDNAGKNKSTDFIQPLPLSQQLSQIQLPLSHIHVVENGETEKGKNILHTTKQTNICHFVFCIHLNN